MDYVLEKAKSALASVKDNNYAKSAVAGVLAVASAAANAAADITATTAELTDAKTAVLAVGVAVLSIVVGIMLYKWIKRAL
jgi:hypothetical protein